ncbi:MAG: hypothetical protein MUO82_10655 [Candidatus Thermoplasmatota archaeon]|nr:hypothetical protein [Candidatus Thermoplasmatota archaeon]
MERNNIVKKEGHSNFLNFFKREDNDEFSFVDWMDELHKDLSSFWENMNH